MFEQITLPAALHICQNMRQLDRDCLIATLGGFSPEAFAIDRWQTVGAAWAFYQDGVPVLMAGIEQRVPWMGVAWMVSTEAVTNDSWKKIIRFSRNVFNNASIKLQRIEAYAIETWPEACKYPKLFGFKQVNVKQKAGKDGQNVIEFAIIGALG